MQSGDLNPRQLERLARAAARHRGWAAALAGRCRQRRFPANDPLKQAADEALRALTELQELIARMEGEVRGSGE